MSGGGWQGKPLTPIVDPLPLITDAFVCRPDCPVCDGSGTVCDDHPDRPWGPAHGPVGGCDCGAPGTPCPQPRV